MKNSRPARKAAVKKDSLALQSGVLLEILINGKPTLLCVVRGAVERLAESLGFPGAECRSITLAVDEAITNIIRHSYAGREDRPIAIYFRKARRRSAQGAEQGIEILLQDRGPAVDPAKLCGRDFNDIRPGGLGLHFIEECMDTLKYRRAENMNQWRLTKFIKPVKEIKNS